MNLTICWKETKYEFLKLLRLRRFSVSVVAMPLMFYVFFGLAMPSAGTMPATMAAYLIATYGTFGVMGACLFGIGANVAGERSLGWLELKRVSPLRPFLYLFAKFAASAVFSLAIVTALLALGILFGHVHVSLGEAVRLLAILTIGSLPFGALGTALGYLLDANSAPASLNMLNLPMAFCSGLWVPMMFLPNFVQKIAQFLPPFHLSQLALGALGIGTDLQPARHWEALAAFALIFTVFAVWAYRREDAPRVAQ